MRPALLAWAALAFACCLRAEPGEYFAIQVVDEATGRGVPLVELQSTDRARYYTDSNGYVAFQEPGLMNRKVWFRVSSHGYDFPDKPFGEPGATLNVVPGGAAQVKIRRINIAERLYRVTGRGIYRDTILLGKTPPIEHGDLDGKVMGQDSVQTVLYQGKLFWFWGDTDRPDFFLGNFHTTGATSALPGHGGLDPPLGVNLDYFVDPKTGFAKEMAPSARKDPSPVWVSGVFAVRDARNRERLLAPYARVKGMKAFERGLMLYNDETAQLDEIGRIPVEARTAPGGHPLRVNVAGQEYYYFALPYPAVRVKNDWESVTNLAAYEAFTCLKEGASFVKDNPPLDRDSKGKLVWKWRKHSQPLNPAEIQALVKSGKMRREEIPCYVCNADDGKPVQLHDGGSSVYWNDYRRKWVMIAVQLFGDSLLGEVWFAEANSPEGPWVNAKKVATHAKKNDNQDFYNPLQHPEFAQEGGKLIYFEGTYVNTFSGNPHPTPNYAYNQLMYRLDLSDPRLKMPECPPGLSEARPSKLGP